MLRVCARLSSPRTWSDAVSLRERVPGSTTRSCVRGRMLHLDQDLKRVYEVAERNDVKALRVLLESKPNLLHGGRRSDTPLHLACQQGHVEAVAFLLDQGADISAPGLAGKSPLLDACANGRLNVVRLLLARGADPTARCSRRASALIWATNSASPNAVEVVRLLLEDGRCPVNARDGDGCTALWHACRHDRTDVARVLLLEAGADHTIASRLEQGTVKEAAAAPSYAAQGERSSSAA